jgi:hypothetical protein
MENNFLKIDVVEHRKTGLMVAISKDLPGLTVHGRNEEELDERVPEAIRSMLEAQGHTVESVVKVEEAPATAFRSSTAQYAAALAA